MIGSVGLVDDLEIERLGHDDPSVVLARVQGIIEDSSGEGAEDITSAEMHPCGLFVCFFSYCFVVELGKLIAFRFPFSGVKTGSKNIS